MLAKSIKKKIILTLLIIINIACVYYNFKIYLKNDIYKIRYFLQWHYFYAWSANIHYENGIAKLSGYIPESDYKYELRAQVEDSRAIDGIYLRVDYKEEPSLSTNIYLSKEILINYNLLDFLKGKNEFDIYYYGDFNLIFTVEEDDKGYFISMGGKDYEYTYYENVEPIQAELREEFENIFDTDFYIAVKDTISIIDKASEEILADYKIAYKRVTVFKVIVYIIFTLCQVGIYYSIRKKYINKTGSEK